MLTATGFPSFFPGVHFFIEDTTLTASASSNGLTGSTTLTSDTEPSLFTMYETKTLPSMF